MSDFVAAGGSLGTIIMGLAVVGAIMTAVFAYFGLQRRRIPLVAWVALPILVCCIGGLGAYSDASSVFEQVNAASEGDSAQTALAGVWEALTVDWMSRWVAAFLFALGAWGAGLGAFLGGAEELRTTKFAGIGAAVVSVLGSVGVMAYANNYGLGQEATYMGAIILFGGLGVAIGAFRRALDHEAQRLAGMRFASAICMLMSVSYASKALQMSAKIRVYGAEALQTGTADLSAVLTQWAEIAAPVQNIGWMAFAIAAMIAFFGFFWELAEVVERYTLLDVWATLALLLILGGVRGMERGETDALLDLGTHAPATEILADLGSDMTSSALIVDKVPFVAKPHNGGFGDVIEFRKTVDEEGNTASEEWYRIWEWNGQSWDADDTAIAGIQLSARPPLLAMTSGDDGTRILSALDKTEDGRAVLLLRAGEVGGEDDDTVPDDLAYLQLAFLPVQASTERDLEKEAWAVAGTRGMNWGPTTWYGKDDGEDALIAINSMFEDTEATGAHVLITERSRVRDVADLCLASIMSPVPEDEDGEAEGDAPANAEEEESNSLLLTERFCRLSGEEADVFRGEAADIWPLPESDHLTMKVSAEGGDLDEDEVIDRFKRELGAIAYCVYPPPEEDEEGEDGVAEAEEEEEEEEEEPVVGVMDLEVGISPRGNVVDMAVGEKSKLTERSVAKCAAKRFRSLKFGERETKEQAVVKIALNFK